MFFYRTKHLLFLDFGHAMTKAAYVTSSGHTYTLQQFECLRTPEKIMENQQVSDPLKFKTYAHELMKRFPKPAQSGDIHLTASDQYTFLKKVTLPTPLPKNLDQHMLYEAEQIAPYPIAEAVVDYSVMDNDPYFSYHAKPGESQILTTLSKQSILTDIQEIFEEISFPLSIVSPGSIGLFNVGLHQLYRKEFEHIAMAHMGDVSTLLLFISPQHVRFFYYPSGLRECLLSAVKQCDLSLSEGRYFAENFSEKNVPDIFVSAFKQSLNKTCENISGQIVNLSEASPDKPVPVLWSGGSLKILDIESQFNLVPELLVTPLTFQTHLSRKNVKLVDTKWADEIAAFFPALIGHLEALSS
jgi:Tfp pilus assembly PilM family ATPase